MIRRLLILLPALAIGVLLSAASVLAHSDAADCNGGDAAWDAAVSYDVINDECDLNTAIVQNGVVPVGHTLHIGPTGKITTTTGPGPASGGLTLNITDHDGPGGGGLIIDTPSGAAGSNGISGDVVNMFGRPITISATGDVLLHGDGTKGARITSSRTGLGDAAGGGGNITINAGFREPDGSCSSPASGDMTMEPGSGVLANSSKSRAGDIVFNACRDMDLDGRVESRSTQSGVPGDTLGGRQITLDAGCELLVSDTGVISSQAQDPRADRVHLSGGCLVTIYGLVQSIAVGHDDPTGINGCKDDPATAVNGPNERPGKPANSTNCVEIWSGGPLIVDSTGTHNGEVNADSGGQGGNTGTGWADLFAKGDITIIGETTGALAVHADGRGGSGGAGESGGLVTIKSTEGSVSTSARAVSAFVTSGASNGDGGGIVVEAFGNAALGASLFDSGGAQTRGSISVRSFNGQVTGNAPGLLDTCGNKLGPEVGPGTNDNTCEPAVPVSPNLVTLQGCGPDGLGKPPALANDGVSYTGTTDPTPFTQPDDACGGAPALPSYVALPDCACGEEPCSKSGTKFEDLDGDGVKEAGEPGLPDWTINLYADNGDGVFGAGDPLIATDVTDATGFYEFLGLAPGVFHVREVCPLSGWIQTLPTPTAATEGACGTGIYTITLEPGENEVNNDFGNFRPITKSGTKYDYSAEGTITEGTPLDGWTINLYRDNGNGFPDGGDTFVGSDVTGPGGAYGFPGLGPGTYFVCEVLQAGWTQTYPSAVGGEVIDTCDDIGNAPFGYKFTATSGVNETGNDFGNDEVPFVPITKSGTKYEFAGEGEVTGGTPLDGWTINLYLDDGDGMPDPGDTPAQATAVTGAGAWPDGYYEFPNLGAGTYFVCEVGQIGWTQTYPNVVGGDVINTCDSIDPANRPWGYQFTAVSGQDHTGNDFGNFQPEGGDQGCTPGFWGRSPNGTSLWNESPDADWTAVTTGDANPPFTHDTLFNASGLFSTHANLAGLTMLDLVGNGGGPDPVRKAARSLVAAYLNAAIGLDYPYSTAQLIAMWNDANDGDDTNGEFLALHIQLDAANNLHNNDLC